MNDARITAMCEKPTAAIEMTMACAMFADVISRQIVGETSKFAAAGAFAGLSPEAVKQMQDREVIKLVLSDASIMQPVLEGFVQTVRKESAKKR